MYFAYIERHGFMDDVLVEIADEKKETAKESRSLINTITLIYVGF